MSDESQEKKGDEGFKPAREALSEGVTPASKEIGKELGEFGLTVVKAMNMALEPLKRKIVSWENSRIYIEETLPHKLKDVPPERIVAPKANVAGPALLALPFFEDEPILRDMFANLLATSMDAEVAKGVHPSFVETIKQMTSDEARIIALFKEKDSYPLINVKSLLKEGAYYEFKLYRFSLLGELGKCESLELTIHYLDNLERLGLVNIPDDLFLAEEAIYDELENHPVVKEIVSEIDARGDRVSEIVRKMIHSTDLGGLFLKACVK